MSDCPELQPPRRRLLPRGEARVGPPGAGELVEIGLTDVAQNLAKRSFRSPRRRSAASCAPSRASPPWRAASGSARCRARWPVCSSRSTTAVVAQPGLINSDPYGAGWIARIEPDRLGPRLGGLVTGADGIAAYERIPRPRGHLLRGVSDDRPGVERVRSAGRPALRPRVACLGPARRRRGAVWA